MTKIMTILGTRPEIIKMSRVIAELDKHVDHVLVHSGQNYDYELNEVFFNDLGVRKPDYFLNVASERTADMLGNIISASDKVMEAENPDAILIYGDTNTGLSVIAAKRRKIPVFHMEAGNRSFDQRVPEELNRKVIDHLSDINFVLSEHARRYLLAEGIKPETIIHTGSHMQEVFNYYAESIESSKILENLNLKKDQYLLVSAHREENVDVELNLSLLLQGLQQLQVEFNVPVIVSTHPRTRKRLEALESDLKDKNIKFLNPFGFFDYVQLQKNALCVISDSGTIFEESSLLDLVAVTMREAHERPEGNDQGSVIMTGLKTNRLVESVHLAINHKTKDGVRKILEVETYKGGPVSKKILRIVLSYIDYVNRTVWSK
jgi:UDP-N-acetylglucosamine 2-epimerase (non-hydrolysing)